VRRSGKGSGLEVWRTPYRVPRANAIAERFVGRLRRECLDHLLIFSERQLYWVIAAYIACLNGSRLRPGIVQQVLGGRPTSVEPIASKIIAFPVLNGLHHTYQRAV
jgi:putative transposase